MRKQSSEFQRYFCLATIHSPRFRNYVIGKVRTEFLTEWGPQKIYEIVTKLHKKQKYVSFVLVEEEIKRDLTIDDSKVQELLQFIEAFRYNTENIDSMIQNVLPRVEEEVGRNVLTQAIITSQDLLEHNKFGDIFTLFDKTRSLAIYQSSQELDVLRDLETNDSDDILEWEQGIPLGITGLDDQGVMRTIDLELYNKGLPRGSIFVIGGNAKGGKSALKLNIAIFQSLLGYNVDFYSLELPIAYMKARILSMITGLNTNDLRSEENKIRAKQIKNSVFLKFPNKGELRLYWAKAHSLTMSTIAQNTMYSESQGRKVDSIMVDYVGRMACERKFGESWQEEGYNILELRDLGGEYSACTITSSQLDKDAYNKKLNTRVNVRGAFSKIADCDLFGTLNRSKEKTINGDIWNTYFYLDAARYSDGGIYLQLEGDLKNARIFNPIPDVKNRFANLKLEMVS